MAQGGQAEASSLALLRAKAAEPSGERGLSTGADLGPSESGFSGLDPAGEGRLVERCLAGERDAWRELHRRFHPVASSFLRRLGVEGRELDDACQEVFLRLYRSLPTFRGEAELKTWLYRLCATEAGRVRRHSRLASGMRRVLGFEPPPEPLAGPEMSDRAALEKVRNALRKMNDGERLVFVLYEMEALSGAQISEVAGCPVATVWRRLHYARRKFRETVLGTEEALA